MWSENHLRVGGWFQTLPQLDPEEIFWVDLYSFFFFGEFRIAPGLWTFLGALSFSYFSLNKRFWIRS